MNAALVNRRDKKIQTFEDTFKKNKNSWKIIKNVFDL